MISKQALGKTLWGMANILYDKVDDYKSYILPLLFYKRLSDNYQWEDENNIKQFVKDNGREPTATDKNKKGQIVFFFIKQLLMDRQKTVE